MEYRLDGDLAPGKFVSVTRPYPGEPRHNGLFLGAGESLALLLQFHDFYPEGYTVLRIEDILEVCSGERERFWEHILNMEHLTDYNGCVLALPLYDMKSFLETRIGDHIILECERRDPEEDEFYIGRLLSLGGDSATLRTFSSMGVWDIADSEVRYSDITKLQFDTPYIKTMTKYLVYPGMEEKRGT